MNNYFKDIFKMESILENCTIHFLSSLNKLNFWKINAISSNFVFKIDLQLFLRIHEIIEFLSFSRINKYLKKYIPKFKPICDQSLNLSIKAIKAKKFIVRDWLQLVVWSLRIKNALKNYKNLEKSQDPFTSFIKSILQRNHELSLRVEQVKIFLYDKIRIISMKNAIPNLIIIYKNLILNLSENKFSLLSSFIHLITTSEKVRKEILEIADNVKLQEKGSISKRNMILKNSQNSLNEPNPQRINAMKSTFLSSLENEILCLIGNDEEKENKNHNRRHSETERRQKNRNISKYNEEKEKHYEFYSEDGKYYTFDTFIIVHKQNNSEAFRIEINLLKQKIEYFFHLGDCIISLYNNDLYSFENHLLQYLNLIFSIISRNLINIDLFHLINKIKNKETFSELISYFLKSSSILIEHGAIQLKLSDNISGVSVNNYQNINKKNWENKDKLILSDDKILQQDSKDLDIIEMLPSSFQAFSYEDKYIIKAFGISLVSHINPLNSYNKLNFLFENIKNLFFNSHIIQAISMNIRMKESNKIKKKIENKSILKRSEPQFKKVRFNLFNIEDEDKPLRRNCSPPPKMEIFKENDKEIKIRERNIEDDFSKNQKLRMNVSNTELKEEPNRSDIYLNTEIDSGQSKKVNNDNTVKENKITKSEVKAHKSSREKIIPFSKLYEGIRKRQKRRASKLLNFSKKFQNL